MPRQPNERLVRIIRWWARVTHGRGVRRIRVELDDDTEHQVTVSPRSPPARPAKKRRKKAAHSPDFATVRWGGKLYSFAEKQRAVVGMLWTAWRRGVPDVDQQTLLAEAESDSSQLRDLFRRHKAWNKMIVPGQRGGTYRIADEPR